MPTAAEKPCCGSSAGGSYSGVVGHSGAARACAPESAPAEHPSFLAYAAHKLFATDFLGSILVLLLNVVYTAGAIGKPVPASPSCEEQRAVGAARATFPCEATLPHQVLHVIRYASWYAFAYPVRLRDWAWLIATLDFAAVACLLLLLALLPRNSGLWRFWCRYRDVVLSLHTPMERTICHCLSYALLPRHRWPHSAFVTYTVGITTRPIVDIVFITCYSSLLRVRTPFAVLLAATHTAAIFALSNTVTPHLLPLPPGPTPVGATGPNFSGITGGAAGSGGDRAAQVNMPVSQLHPAWQALVAAVCVGVPVAVAYVAEHRMRVSYARMVQLRGGRSEGLELPPPQAMRKGLPGAELAEPEQEASAAAAAEGTRVGALRAEDEQPGRGKAAAGSAPAGRWEGATTSRIPANKIATKAADITAEGASAKAAGERNMAAASGSTIGLPGAALDVAPIAAAVGAAAEAQRRRRRATSLGYRGLTRLSTVSVKVLEHPGSFEEYSRRLAAAAPAILARIEQITQAAGHKEDADSAAASTASNSRPAAGSAPRVLEAATTGFAVVRGCVQLVAWRRRAFAAAAAAAAAAGCGAAAPARSSQDITWCSAAASSDAGPVLPTACMANGSLLRDLVSLLPDGERVSGLSVQPGAAAPEAPEAAEAAAGGAPAAAVQLVGLQPPVLALPDPAVVATAAWPPAHHQVAALRVTLDSPRAQAARLVLLGRGAGAGGDGGGDGAQGAALLGEFAVELGAGVQVVELRLGLNGLGLEAQGAAAGPQKSSPRVLNLLLLPPAHDDSLSADGAPPQAEAATVGRAASRAERPAPRSPLVHFAAPLLVLPGPAAAELCEVWDGLCPCDGGATERARHPEVEAVTRGWGTHAVAPAAVSRQRREAWSSLFAPLLGDLSYLLEATETAEAAGGDEASNPDAASVQAVAASLLQYCRGNGLAATAAVVAGAAAGAVGCGAEASTASSSAPDAPAASGGAARAAAPATTGAAVLHTGGGCRIRGTAAATVLANAAAVNVSHCRTKPVSCPSGGASNGDEGEGHQHCEATVPAFLHHVTVIHLLRGFHPASLEKRYRGWCALRLGRSAPYLLAVLAQPYTLTAVRAVQERYPRMGAQVGLVALEWAAGATTLEWLLLWRWVWQRRAREARTATPPGRDAPALSHNSAGCIATGPYATAAGAPEAAAAAACGTYEWLASFVWLSLYATALAAAHDGFLTTNGSLAAGSWRVTAVVVLCRALVFPCLLPLGLRRLTKSPLTVALRAWADTMALILVSSHWGWRRVATVVALV